MKLTELQYIVALARERHFGRAAELCDISQPSLSVAVKKLETELGVTLFERRSQEISLTPVGEVIIEQARKVLQDVHQIKALAAQGQDPLCGALRLGVIYTVSPYLMPGLVAQMQTLTPQMPLILSEDYTDNLLEQLKAGTIDVAIMALPIHEPGLMLAPLYEEDFVFIAPQNHPLSQKEMISKNDIPTEQLLLLGKGHCLREQIVNVCAQCAGGKDTLTSIQKTVEGSSLLTIRQMVLQGLGVSLVPASSLDQCQREALTAIAFEKPTPARRVIIVWRKSFNRQAAIEKIREAVRLLNLPGCKYLNLPPVSTATEI